MTQKAVSIIVARLIIGYISKQQESSGVKFNLDTCLQITMHFNSEPETSLITTASINFESESKSDTTNTSLFGFSQTMPPAKPHPDQVIRYLKQNNGGDASGSRSVL